MSYLDGYVTSTVVDGVRGFWYEGRFYPIIAGGEGDDDGGTGGSDDAGGDDSGDDGDDGDDAGSGGTAGPLSFTTKQLNERLERARRAERKKLAREAGFGDDVEGYKKSINEFKTKRDTDRGELETLRTRNAELTGQVGKLSDRLRATNLSTTVSSVAQGLDFHDPSDVISLADFTDTQDDDGDVDKDAVKAILTDLAKKKPYLVKAKDAGAGGTGGGSRNAGVSNPPRNAGTSVAAKDEEIKKRFPILESLRKQSGG